MRNIYISFSAALFQSNQKQSGMTTFYSILCIFVFLFSDYDVPVAFDVTQLAAVEVHQQLSEAGVGGREVNLGFRFLARTHGGAEPAE